jgi:hypothetical protein
MRAGKLRIGLERIQNYCALLGFVQVCRFLMVAST